MTHCMFPPGINTDFSKKNVLILDLFDTEISTDTKYGAIWHTASLPDFNSKNLYCILLSKPKGLLKHMMIFQRPSCLVGNVRPYTTYMAGI